MHPPRPKDPKQVWEQQYAVKLRLKSTGMTMLAEGDTGGGSRARAPARGSAVAEAAAARRAATAARAPAGTDAVQEGINVLRGLFGR